MESIRNWARRIKRDALMLWFARRHPDTPFLTKALCVVTVAYALSPIDLIPDFIPVLGYLDDLVIVPLGLMLVLRLVPAEVLATSQAKARDAADRPTSRAMAAAIVAIWVLAAGALGLWAWQALRP